jgi:hypothetical protein
MKRNREEDNDTNFGEKWASKNLINVHTDNPLF